jgi:hypothetical protein
LTGGGGGGGISVLKMEQALRARAHPASSNRFMDDPWIRK